MSFEKRYTYYDPSATKDRPVLPEGNYKARVSKCEYNRTWKSDKNECADIYDVYYKLDNSIGDAILTDANGKEYQGSDFINTEIKSKGFFLWKSPVEDDQFVGNPIGNKRIFIFLEAIDYPLEKKKITTSKGSEIEVIQIPEEIEENLMIDKPVIIEVNHREWKDKIYANETKIMKWKDAPSPEPAMEEEDDLPF